MVPRVWPSSTIVCIGSGPSLTAADLDTVRDSPAKSIVINTTYQQAPWANVLFGPDLRWWGWHPDALAFKGFKVGLGPRHEPGVMGVEWTGDEGIELSPHAVRTGGHAGYAAVNLAFHLGARRIVLLGYDLAPSADGRHHHHPDHPNGSHPSYEFRRDVYQTCLEPLLKRKVTVVNASRRSAITAIPRMTLEQALC